MPHASVTIVDETGTLYNIAETKLLMTNENVSTIVRTSRKSQPSPMTTTRERDRILDHKTTTTQILNTIPTLLQQDLVIAIVRRTIGNQNFSNQNHNNQSNSNKGQNQRTGQNNYNFPARQNNNSNTQYNQNFPQNNSNALSNNVQFIDDDSQEMINSISNDFALNY